MLYQKQRRHRGTHYHLLIHRCCRSWPRRTHQDCEHAFRRALVPTRVPIEPNRRMHEGESPNEVALQHQATKAVGRWMPLGLGCLQPAGWHSRCPESSALWNADHQGWGFGPLCWNSLRACSSTRSMGSQKGRLRIDWQATWLPCGLVCSQTQWGQGWQGRPSLTVVSMGTCWWRAVGGHSIHQRQCTRVWFRKSAILLDPVQH